MGQEQIVMLCLWYCDCSTRHWSILVTVQIVYEIVGI